MTTQPPEALPPEPVHAALHPIALVLVFAPVVTGVLVARQLGAGGVFGIALGVLAATFAMRRQKLGWRDFGMRSQPLAATLLWALAATAMMIAVTALGQPIVSRLVGPPDLSAFDALVGNTGVLIAGLVVVWTTAAFGEEMLFRGVMLSSFMAWMSRAGAALPLVLMGVLFGLGHSYQGAHGVIMTGLLGLGLGVIYLVTQRNLWVVILAHGFYDTIGFLVVYLGYGDILTGGGG